MAKQTYAEQLLSPNWDKKRVEIINRDNLTCTQCGIKNTMLHVHHIKYLKNKKAWDYPNELLTTLCEVCHKLEHTEKTELESVLITMYFNEIKNKQQWVRTRFAKFILNYLELNKKNGKHG